jgi:hypothetical protein
MICWFENAGNNIAGNVQHQYFLSSVSSAKAGFFMCDFFFRKGLSLHIARNREIIVSDYINHDDVYLAPLNEGLRK